MLQPVVLQPHLIDAFKRLIADKLGFHLREQSQAIFWQRVLQRVQVLSLPSLEAYYQLLSSNHQPITENPEWRELISFLSVTESYFFRDQGQFSLLRNQILPELIAWKQKLASEGRTQERSLKIWSAGCATGEEAYSIAILLKELIPAEEEWALSIIGTDFNQAALLQAQRGVYSDWSFRSVHSAIQKKYFQQYRREWKISPDIAKLVTFRLDNLVSNNHYSSEPDITNIDLIICRNVFIYFDAKAIDQTLERFHQALSPGGYLMTGHTELHGHRNHPFKIKSFSESVIYQRAFGESLKPVIAPQSSHISPLIYPQKVTTLSTSCPTACTSLSTKPDHTELNSEGIAVLEDIITLLKQKFYGSAIAQAKQLISQNLYPFRAYCLLAEAYANLGQHVQAIQACQQAFQYDPLAIEPLYLLAQIAQDQGEVENAKSILKRVIYLAPTSIFAYFELGCLYEQQGNLEKARRNWQSSLNGLKQLTGETMIDGCKDLTASELRLVIESKLNQEACT